MMFVGDGVTRSPGRTLRAALQPAQAYPPAGSCCVRPSLGELASGSATGSNNGLGLEFRPFGINGLEMADQTVKSWNPLLGWLHHLRELWSAA
jgi:hypothetical protein